MTRIPITAALLLGALMAAPAARASVLAPGSVVLGAGDSLTVAGATVTAGSSGTIASLPLPPDFRGSFVSDVFRNPLNTFGAGDLTWLIQVTNTGPGSIVTITTSSFAGFLTDVGINTDATLPSGKGVDTFVLGGTSPGVLVRDVTGADIGFDFLPGLAAGTTSAILQIDTNATSVVPGVLSEIGGGVAFETPFGPADPAAVITPLPAALPLFATGLGALGLLGWRRKRKAQAVRELARAELSIPLM